MVKRTLYFGNPAYLSVKYDQLEIRKPEDDAVNRIPIEDIGYVILEHQQLTITHAVLNKLLDNNVAVITCNERHHPTGMILNLDGHTKQSKIFRHQLEATNGLKRRLWQQTVKSKIKNQSRVLKYLDLPDKHLLNLAKTVKMGDNTNHEAIAAGHYWKAIFEHDKNFYRDRYGPPPNHMLNYGYAILRAAVARALVGSGLLPTYGIFHRNQYNAFCLADDIMEPYRPFVDLEVIKYTQLNEVNEIMGINEKKYLLNIPAMNIKIGTVTKPLMLAVQQTTASLAACFEGLKSEIKYPKLSNT
jgi:CRISPR-associated protein Cas1